MRNGKIRIIALTVAVVIMGALCGFRLMEYQIVKGEKYLEAANSKTVSEVSVNAARGKIVDRYGKELVTNKAGFNLVFDRAFLKEETENETILALTKILQKAGDDWIDELPVSKSAPYEFLPGKDDEVTRMKTKLGMQTYATAEECMNAIVEKFKLENYSGDDLRTLAGVRYGMFAKDFSIYNRYTFAEDVTPSTVSTIEELSFRYPGVSVSAESIRDYGEGAVIPHILGTMSAIFPDEVEEYTSKGYALNDLVGRSGIEEVMEPELRGTSGTIRVEQNNKGEVISTTTTKEPVAGNSVVLTIDTEFQVKVQEILENFIHHLNRAGGRGKEAQAGAIVVLDPNTGEVLAAATYPTYTLADLKDSERSAELINDPLNPMKNRAFREIYRPGSTFKTITSTAGLMEGVINASSLIYCGGTYYYDTSENGYHPVCTGVHRNITVVEALKYSCNIFFYEVGRRLGIDRLDKYAAMYGFGEETGLEIGNEKGYMASPALTEKNGGTWYMGNTWQAAIGQSDTKITPLQLAIQAMTLANKGTRYAAHIIKSVNSYDLTQTVKQTQPEILNNELSGNDDVYAIVHRGMQAVADRRATMVNMPGGVAIKTGTPQVTKTEYNSVVVGFYPAESTPEIAFAAVIERGEYSADMMAQVINAYNELKAKRSGQTAESDSSESSSATE